MTNILLADDHQIILDGLKKNLDHITSVNIVGMARNGEECLSILQREKVDMAILDLSMPGMSGEDVFAHMQMHFPLVKVMILSSYEDADQIWRLKEAGISGYLPKTISQQELLKAIDQVNAGGTYFARGITEIMKNGPTMVEEATQIDLYDLFTKREIQVLNGIMNDLTSQAIAQELDIAESTVLSHRKNLYLKAEVHSTTGLIRFAVENGYQFRPK